MCRVKFLERLMGARPFDVARDGRRDVGLATGFRAELVQIASLDHQTGTIGGIAIRRRLDHAAG